MNCFMLQERKPFTVVIPYHEADQPLVERLLDWIEFLGGAKEHSCLLVSDFAVSPDAVLKVKTKALNSFRQVDTAFNNKPTPGWIKGSNSLWLAAAGWCKDHGQSWLCLEPDCVPLQPNWLYHIQVEYWNCGKPMLAHIYDGEGPHRGKRFMSGIAVYGPTAFTIAGRAVQQSETDGFDICCSRVMMPYTAPSQTIQHFWGEAGLPPTFVRANSGEFPRNTLTPASLKQGAVLFHRCKDGSLIDLLKPTYQTNPMMVVYPFCNKDVQMALKNLQWICELNPYNNFDLVLSYEENTNAVAVRDATFLGQSHFRTVRHFKYSDGRHGEWQPTVAFKSLAIHMQQYERPWLWMEFDAIPLKPNWLDVLQKRYFDYGKPFAGPIVPTLGHMNGTAIYPSDTPVRIKHALTRMHTAWDTEMRTEIMDQCRDISDIYQHVWGVVNGGFHPFMGGPPSFDRTNNLFRYINPSAVIFHRCKDGTLIDRLREHKPK